MAKPLTQASQTGAQQWAGARGTARQHRPYLHVEVRVHDFAQHDVVDAPLQGREQRGRADTAEREKPIALTIGRGGGRQLLKPVHPLEIHAGVTALDQPWWNATVAARLYAVGVCPGRSPFSFFSFSLLLLFAATRGSMGNCTFSIPMVAVALVKMAAMLSSTVRICLEFRTRSNNKTATTIPRRPILHWFLRAPTPALTQGLRVGVAR